MLLAGLGRFVQDLLLWCTAEFGYVRFGDGFVQASSIMPQKRNPVAIEHARAIGSKALGQAQAIVTSVHNTPFGDIVDTEDDLQPLVFAMFRDATRAVKLVAAAMSTAEFDAARLEARAGDGWTTLTELADTLVREHGLPFSAAHAIAGAPDRRASARPEPPARGAARGRVDRAPRRAARVFRGGAGARCSARGTSWRCGERSAGPRPRRRRGPPRSRAGSSRPTRRGGRGATDALGQKPSGALAERSAAL